MPVYADFRIQKFEDGVFTVGLQPPVSIGGWSINFFVATNFGGSSGVIQKSITSGYSAASGITILNSGQGVFSIQINSADTSGLDTRNYAHTIYRADPGFDTVLAEGFLIIGPR